ncbi:tetratricopeptide repeat protein [Clostridium uliginosum]|uniref:Tetratricopeptide repeat-containing protein n=1 Tax=Clostridium uliginosum TaxID=119641 RepID=A0A1I1K0A4_9CLOT|nr:tetratricopeptide repeat protein [Clostridium uliginosum]SFC54244.1 Tetratricopeptide repeat-containing protein [Clostridium uliginosum]
MNYKTMYKDKLSKILFLEMDKEGFKKNIKVPEYVTFHNKDLYMPISSEYIASNANNEIKIHNLPIYYFIEGMFIVFGCDEKLKYNEDYGIVLTYIPNSEECIKSLIANRVKEDKLEDAYILLKGLYRYNREEEILKNLLLTGESIREKNSSFDEILLEDIEECKSKFNKMPEPYLYNALILRDKGDYINAQAEINEYLNKGGSKTGEIEQIINDINNISQYEKAIEILNEEPEKAIEILLPLTEQFEKNPLLYYYLAIGYRNLENYEKAIYYLNESLTIESGILEVVNELGINYACLGNYQDAIKYFKKAFEASKDVEICTNIVMCYMNLGNDQEAKIHLEIAKKLKPEDEIVKELDKTLLG